jgi:hypothetical protein
MQPTLHRIPLADGSVATVPIFMIESLLLSLLNDPLHMMKENFAPDYDIFTGWATSSITHIDEVHLGSLWEPVCHQYCGEYPNTFPLALIGFYSKTNTDVHGSLSCVPFIATPSFLNIDSRNDNANYMVLGYIPNLGLGKGTKQAVSSTMKVQDKYICLHLITEQIMKIHQKGGFWTTIMGQQVCVVVWIHLVAGDTAGHNNLMGHYNSGKVRYIYQECWCLFEQLSNPKPQCTLADLAHAQLTDGHLKNLCKKNIANAFDDLPLSNVEHGLMGCIPAEMLYVSGTGLLEYIFVSICNLIGLEKNNKKEREQFDDLHQCLVQAAQHQNECDRPQMSIQNRISDGTKMCSSEHVGNCFILLCVLTGQKFIKPGLRNRNISLKRIISCLI